MKKIRVALIRHGTTAGNVEKRYIGKTDEDITLHAINRLCIDVKSGRYGGIGTPDIVISSPMKRCISTAQIIFVNSEIKIVNDLREMDFGVFENKNYKELNGNADYQRWVDGNCEGKVPGGENRAEFSERCVAAFDREIVKSLEIPKVTEQKNAKNADDNTFTIAFVVHGGTIMSIMERYSPDKGTYYDYQCENGGGYLIEINSNGMFESVSTI